MTDYPTIEELKSSLEWAIKQGGNDNYLLNDYFYPYTWGYYLYMVKEQTGSVILAQTTSQLFAALAGGPQPEAEDLPKYNIDWDIRNDISGNICVYKKKDGTRELTMGTLDFNTPEEGAKIWLEQIKDKVPKGIWTTTEERAEMDKEINDELQRYYDEHCSDEGDCAYKAACEVRWAGGHGLRGCRRENPDDAMWK